MIIGICDDIALERQITHDLCECYFHSKEIEHEYVLFSSGEEVLDYCNNADNKRIDLLFLDIEMNGMSGIDLMDVVIDRNKIWRIVYVSGHQEVILDTYSIKTIGFILKPPTLEMISDKIQKVVDQLNKKVYFTIKDIEGARTILLRDILYFKAAGSYTELYTYDSLQTPNKYYIVSKKLGTIEKKLEQYPVIRVHRSYLVNMQNASVEHDNVLLPSVDIKIPIGRVYRNELAACNK